MLVNTSGIVLKKTPYTGSSAVVSILTEQFGPMAFMVRGIGKKGARAAALEPLAKVDVGFKYRAKPGIHTASQISLKPGISFYSHPLKSAISIFLAEVLYKTLREESADEELFHFIYSALELFDKQDFSPNFHLVFLLKLTKYFGFFPSGKWSDQAPYFDLLQGEFTPNKNSSLHMLSSVNSKSFFDLAVSDMNEKSLQISNTQRRNLLKGIIEYYQIQLEGMGNIKSLDILMEVFS